MIRVKLFFFGLCVSFIGVFRPKEVLDLIQAYDEVKTLRDFKEKVIKALGVDTIEKFQ